MSLFVSPFLRRLPLPSGNFHLKTPQTLSALYRYKHTQSDSYLNSYSNSLSNSSLVENRHFNRLFSSSPSPSPPPSSPPSPQSSLPSPASPSPSPSPSSSLPLSVSAIRRYAVKFTCVKCQGSTSTSFSHHSYHHGVVLIRCSSCRVLHLFADNLKWFDDNPINIEGILKEKGESVKFLNAKNPSESPENAPLSQISENFEISEGADGTVEIVKRKGNDGGKYIEKDKDYM